MILGLGAVDLLSNGDWVLGLLGTRCDAELGGKLLSIDLVGVVALGLWHEEDGDDQTKTRDGEEDPEHELLALRGSDGGETQRRDDGSDLARSSAETVCCGTDTGGKYFSRNHESSGIRSEIKEELEENEGGEEWSGLYRLVKCAAAVKAK